MTFVQTPNTLLNIENASVLRYQPRLDGLRAIAVLLVLQSHFVTITEIFTFGIAGVRLFFVLSGYLITKIIFNYRSKFISTKDIFILFYWRRTIRLLPPLLIVIGSTLILDIGGMRQNWLWHLFYLSNIKIFLDSNFGPAGPLWSLSVEEQFYLLWFPLILLLPNRWILFTIIISIIFGLFFSVIVGQFLWVDVLLPANIDYLALGALLSYAEVYDKKINRVICYFVRKLWLLIGLTLIVFTSHLFNNQFSSFIYQISTAALAFCLISIARNNDNNTSVIFTCLLNFLKLPILVHIGKISYGLYIYHYFVSEYLNKIGILALAKISIGGRPLMLSIELSITFIIAELSWFVIERPISRFKSCPPWQVSLIDQRNGGQE